MERGLLVLRNCVDLPVKLTGRGLIKAHGGRQVCVAERLQQVQGAQRVHSVGGHGCVERDSHVALGCKVEYLRGPDRLEQVGQGALVVDVQLMEKHADVTQDMLNPAQRVEIAGSTNQTVDDVALGE
eukprot:3933466-Pyramimonas_sp.AAC.1